MAKGTGLTKTKYQVSSALGAIVGNGPISRPEITKKIWAYIKKHDLQDNANRRQINPNSTLGKVTGSKSFDMMQLAKKLGPHIG